MTFLNRSSWLPLCLLLCTLWTGTARGAEEETVTLNFVNADIESVIKAVGMISNRNFIIDPRVKGTVNIVSAKPVARDMTYQILLSALRLQGFPPSSPVA
jgi:general secretion pathway protein D